MTTIRNETPDDHGAVRAITVESFANSDLGHNGEAELIERLRAECADHLSLVACLDSEIVGHILFTPVSIRTQQHEIHGMGLAPLSVTPPHQKTGIGSLLVRNGLDRLYVDHCPFVVVLGHPDYYSQFGFQRASNFNVSHGFVGIPQDFFFIQFAKDSSIKQPSDSRAYYRPEFGVQHEGK